MEPRLDALAAKDSRSGWRRGETTRLLLVRCGQYRLGFPSRLVRGVVAPGEIVPLELPDLAGLMWRDGALIPATRLGPRLGLGSVGQELAGHGVLIRSEEGLLCLLVDEALDLVEVPSLSILPMPRLVTRVVALEGLESVAMLDRPLLVADPVRLLGPGGAARLIASVARVEKPGSAGEGAE